MALELLNPKDKQTRPAGLRAQLTAIEKAAGELEDTRARIAALTQREDRIKAELAKSGDPGEVERLYDELVTLEEQSRKNKFLLPATARAQAIALQELIAAYGEAARVALGADAAKENAKLDLWEPAKAKLDADYDQAFRQRSMFHDRANAVTQIVATIGRAGPERVLEVVNEQIGSLRGVVDVIDRYAEGEASSTTREKGA